MERWNDGTGLQCYDGIMLLSNYTILQARIIPLQNKATILL
jgi:hypothetical protein